MNWKSGSAPAQGYVAPGFEAVAEEFARNFTIRGDRGAAFAAMHRGQLVVDLWGGTSAPGIPWTEDTLQVIFSGTKGLVASCMLLLIERGRIALDAPVARYWPEFAQNGKDRVLVRHVVSHTSGVTGVLAPLTRADLTDPEKVEHLIEAQPLFSDPTAFNAYHALTIGWLCDAIVRRVDGRSLGRFFHDEFAIPLGLDVWIGLPEAEERRVGSLELGAGMLPYEESFSPEQRADPLLHAIWGNPPLFGAGHPWNRRAFHAAEIPGAGGIATARGMARYYGCLAVGGTLDGVSVLQAETVALGRRELSSFTDPFAGEALAFGVCWNLQAGKNRFGPAPDAYGHTGAGGSIHGAWPTQGVGLSYVMNELRGDPDDLRTRPVLERLHEIVG